LVEKVRRRYHRATGKELKEATGFINRNVTTVVGDVVALEEFLDRPYAVVKRT